MTALMTMPFGYVGIEHVSICFTVPRARAPLRSWLTWSPHLHVENHFIFFPPLLCATPPTWHIGTYRGTLRPDAQLAVNKQGQSLLCCASRPSCPCSSWFVACTCQNPTTISVAITTPTVHIHFLGYTHIYGDGSPSQPT
jgi:hypothetical protein